MKVTHTVLHLENEQEKEMLIKAVAREVVSKAEVASISNNGCEAELTELEGPQFELPMNATIVKAEPIDMPSFEGPRIVQDVLEPQPLRPENCEGTAKIVPMVRENGPIRTLTSYLFKHKDGNTVTPVYVSRVEEPVEEDVREAKREAALKLLKLLSNTPDREEGDRRISNRDIVSLITANRMAQPALLEDDIHIFTSEDGQRVEVPESLIYHIKNNM